MICTLNVNANRWHRRRGRLRRLVLHRALLEQLQRLEQLRQQRQARQWIGLIRATAMGLNLDVAASVTRAGRASIVSSSLWIRVSSAIVALG